MPPGLSRPLAGGPRPHLACASLLKDVWALQRSKTASSGCVTCWAPKGPPPRAATQAPKRATRASAWVSKRYSLGGPP